MSNTDGGIIAPNPDLSQIEGGTSKYGVPNPAGVFNGDSVQSRRMQAYCRISMGGFDITSNLNPFLLKVHIIDNGKVQIELEIDDRDAKVPIPGYGVELDVALGWVSEPAYEIYTGNVMDVHHSFARKQGGRHMTVVASGVDMYSAIKQPMQFHMGQGALPGSDVGSPYTFQAFMSAVAANHGASVSIHPALGMIQRDYWAQQNESFMHLLHRMAREHGGIAGIRNGTNGVITLPGYAPDGTPSGTVYARWGENLIGWNVVPFSARTAWQGAIQQFYNIQQGKWQQFSKGFSGGAWADALAKFARPGAAPNSQVADQNNYADGQAALPNSGKGVIVINGEPSAKWNMNVVLSGARPGVDGTYFITSAEHTYSRQGYVTNLNVNIGQDANGGAGVAQPTVTPAAAIATATSYDIGGVLWTAGSPLDQVQMTAIMQGLAAGTVYPTGVMTQYYSQLYNG